MQHISYTATLLHEHLNNVYFNLNSFVALKGMKNTERTAQKKRMTQSHGLKSIPDVWRRPTGGAQPQLPPAQIQRSSTVSHKGISPTHFCLSKASRLHCQLPMQSSSHVNAGPHARAVPQTCLHQQWQDWVCSSVWDYPAFPPDVY